MTPLAAANAYATLSGAAPAATTGSATGGGDFASMLEGALRDVAETGAAADTASLEAASGAGNLVEVITAVSESELNVQAVVTIRDRVIEAYQQIMQMPI